MAKSREGQSKRNSRSFELHTSDLDLHHDHSDDDGANSYHQLSQSAHAAEATKASFGSLRDIVSAGTNGQSGLDETFHSEEESSDSNGSGNDDNSYHGLTRRRTALYDDETDKQMASIEAKMLYQRDRFESQRLRASSHSNVDARGGHDKKSRSHAVHFGQDDQTAKETPVSQKVSPFVIYKEHEATSQVIKANASQSGKRREASVSDKSQISLPDEVPRGFEENIPPMTGVNRAADERLMDEFEKILAGIRKVIEIRRKYIKVSLQGPDDNPKDSPEWSIYPPPPQPVWVPSEPTSMRNNSSEDTILTSSRSMSSIKSSKLPRKPGTRIGEDFNPVEVDIPDSDSLTFQIQDGVYQVYDSESKDKRPIVHVPSLRSYYKDLKFVSDMSSDGPPKSLSYRRLACLEASFDLYYLQNGYQEIIDCKAVPHRDFYNVRKVDTHVHHSACMNQKHLLRFMKSKLKKSSDDLVLRKDGKFLTLAEVFETIGLNGYDLSIDTLDMHAHVDTFHRFDKFNLKYNPVGESRLRNIFLKTDNDIKGRYLADVTKEVIADLESSKYQMVEWRISIYGRNRNEWDKLADWVLDNKLVSHNVRWLIQIPRLYNLYQKNKEINNFEDILVNIFEPLFEVTKDPSSHPSLHIFLQRVVGFDSVDDESKPEPRFTKKFPVPNLWSNDSVVPYSYWIYYLFANMTSLNTWRRRRGFNTFVLRPHCGEAGDPDHLCAAFIACHSISHGLLLRKAVLMQYCFYLEQIGVAMSPLSNNALFLRYDRNPFPQYLKRGLNVSLSTDDPLQFAFTKEPLMEEYSIATQIYKLSAVDMCELARNSVLQSGFEHSIKKHWLGPDYKLFGAQGNHPQKTNYPPTRAEYRDKTLLDELAFIKMPPNFTESQLSAQPHLQTSSTLEKFPDFPGPSTNGETQMKSRSSQTSPTLVSQATFPPSQSATDKVALGDPEIRRTMSFASSSGRSDARIFPGLYASARQGSMHENDNVGSGQQ